MLTVKAHIRFLLQRPLQLILTVFGIALGVGVVTAVDLASTSAQRAFQLSIAEVMGNTTHQIVSNNVKGIPEVKYRELRFKFGEYSQMKTTPVVEGVVQINDQHFRLLGVDIFSERNFRENITSPTRGSLLQLLVQSNTILMSDPDARRHGLNIGDKVTMTVGEKRHEVEMAGVITSTIPAAAESLLISDIATAQELLDKTGYIDRIDLIIPVKEDPQLLVGVKNWLPRGTHLDNAQSQSNTRMQTTRAFQINLKAMSLMAILVGGFLIFNTLTFSTLQRRSLIGILRGLGVTRQQTFIQVLTEAAVLGLVGSIFGLLLGLAIGTGLIKLVLQTINDLYFVVNVSSLSITPEALIKGLVIGLTVSIVAALSPGWEAATTTPVTAQHRSVLEKHIHSAMSLIMISGFGIMIISVISLILSNNLVYAFSWLFLFVVGYCISLAPIMILLFKAISPWIKKASLMVRIAIRSIPASLSRTAIAVAALTVAVAATVGVNIMVQSFRTSVEQWLTASLTGDLYLEAPVSGDRRAQRSMPAHITNRLRTIPGVEEIGHARHVEIKSNLGPVNVIALWPPSAFDLRAPLYEGSPDKVWPLFDQGKHILVSEPLARRFKLDIGDLLEMYTDRGRQKFLIGGIVQDFRSDQGFVYIHRNFYNRHWKDPYISGVSMYLNDDTEIDKVKSDIQQILKNQPGIIIHSNKEILTESLNIFDRTFTITDVLRLLAIGVAFFGIFSALLAFQLERIREIAILRATGMTSKQVWVVIGTHTALVGLLSGLFAIPLGLVLAWVLINVINQLSFGWTIDMLVPFSALAEALVIAVFASMLAAIYPAWRMSTISPAQALREE